MVQIWLRAFAGSLDSGELDGKISPNCLHEELL
jgi:hypothetical protein